MRHAKPLWSSRDTAPAGAWRSTIKADSRARAVDSMDCHALQSKARNDREETAFARNDRKNAESQNAVSLEKVDSSSAQSVIKLGTSKARYQCLHTRKIC
ncbi:hypothetical protein NYJ85_01080 [Helicobacter sp. CPD2-1]|nr:hypothetical protein [Helicobacter sp. CPD2-1]